MNEMVDETVYTQRSLVKHRKLQTGDIKFTRGKLNLYSLEITQKLSLVDRGKCTYYQNKKGFKTCDSDFTKRVLKQYYPENFNPFWLEVSENESFHSLPRNKEAISLSNANAFAVFDTYSGIRESDCLLPCLLSSVNVQPLSNEPLRNNTARVTLSIANSKMELNKEKIARLDPLMMLSIIGGNVGLWLGLSILSIPTVIGFMMKKILGKPSQ